MHLLIGARTERVVVSSGVAGVVGVRVGTVGVVRVGTVGVVLVDTVGAVLPTYNHLKILQSNKTKY